jgi:hypothetical protein
MLWRAWLITVDRPGILEALIPGRCRVMAAQRKYPEELRERAVKMVFEIRSGQEGARGAGPGKPGKPCVDVL